jgi:hypothetical protein
LISAGAPIEVSCVTLGEIDHIARDDASAAEPRDTYFLSNF